MASRSVALYDPKTLERARVLDDSVIREFYSDSVRSRYTNELAIKNLLKFSFANREVAGSNIPMLLHLQEINYLYINNMRFSTRNDLETAKKFGLDLSGNYVDFGVALRGENVSCAPNKTSAINLVSQLKQRGIKLGSGKLISLFDLTMKEDANSGYGLTLSLKDDVSVDSIRELADFKWDHINREGVARAFLSGCGSWDLDDSSLAYSNDCGRVVVVGAEDAFRKKSLF